MSGALLFDRINDLKPNLIVKWGLLSMIIFISIVMILAYSINYSFHLDGSGTFNTFNEKRLTLECAVNDITLNPFKIDLQQKKINIFLGGNKPQEYSGVIIKSTNNVLFIKMKAGYNYQPITGISLFSKSEKRAFKITIDHLNLFQILSLSTK